MENDNFCARCIMWKCSDLDIESEIESDEFDGSVVSECLHLHKSKKADDLCDYFLEVL